MSKQTQCDRILLHLKEYGSITSIEAFVDYGIMRLASRINNLKNRGHLIKSELKTGKNRFGDTTHYCVYTLVEEVKQDA